MLKYIESFILSILILIQWIIIVIIFVLFWDIIHVEFFMNRILDQLLKLIIGGSLIIAWLLEWAFSVDFVYRFIRKCNK